MFSNKVVTSIEECRLRFDIYNAHFVRKGLGRFVEIDENLSAGENLQILANESLQSEDSVAYTFIYHPFFLDFISRWALACSHGNKELCVAVADRIGQVIGIYPEALTLGEHFMEKNHEHLNLILETQPSQEEKTTQTILLAYYRFMRQDRERFNIFIKPDTLYAVLQHTFADRSIRFVAAHVLSLYLNLAEQATLNLVQQYVGDVEDICAHYQGDEGVDYRFLELNEARRLSKCAAVLREVESMPQYLSNPRVSSKGVFNIVPTDLSELVVSVYGILVPKVSSFLNPQNASLAREFVPTEGSVSAIRSLAKSVQFSKPVMLIGKAGSGKTFLINQLSRHIGSQDSMVKIHLGEQTDAKLLLGTYTSGEKPGTFEWRAGVLTTAVKEGRWVLIEDIDKAPTEVLSVLLTLLEQRELSIPSRGETIKASNGFQLISTIRIPEGDHNNEEDYLPDLIGIRLWDTVSLKELNDSELAGIISQKYPSLSQLASRFITTYNSVRNIYSNQQFISFNRGVHPRAVTVRDLIKFCNRIQTIFANNNIQSPEQLIPSEVYDSIFFEAADCFAGAIGEERALKPLIEAIGASLEISSSRVSLYISNHVPAFADTSSSIVIGRASVSKNHSGLLKKSVNDTSFARTNHSLRLMEQIGAAIQMCEPVLLVGETGTGKTTVVQQVAKAVNQRLTVINVSQQTESGDLLGGYKPVNTKTVAVPLLEEFESLFPATFSVKKNERFYNMLHNCFNKNSWKNVIKLLKEAFKLAQGLLDNESDGNSDDRKKKRKLDSHTRQVLLDRWLEFYENIKQFEAQYSSMENSFVFNFVEGSLVKAVRNGEWLLLDEVNLASSDTLESISDLLAEPNSRSVLLSEKGQVEPIKAHPNFRIFACMNPATDVGKRDLPAGVRSRFTEIYVHSPDRDISDLLSIIDKYIGVFSVSDEWVGNDVAELYLEAKRLAEAQKIVDGSNQRPHFSIRTLTRTLIYVRDIVKIYGLRRSLYEGFCMSFLTLLDEKSEGLLKPLIEKFTLGRLKNPKSVISQIPSCPGSEYIQFRHYWMRKGLHDCLDQPNYIITPFVEKNMLNLVRATSGRRFPVLIQGPTSAGKTSMIKYLADITGHKFVRINNHEHTDLQEYLGTYVADETGKLKFREGVLVDALREGHWIVLDELNLAPTDVLEALNRLLDDNRELFIPETQEFIHPHPDFMLFATQNPPGIYGGRKVLSRAFRNRFLELHFDDIPQDELEIILRERCRIAPSYAQKIVEVYRQLSVKRSAMRLFEQKNSFATLRDLFRWALRDAVGYENLAANGYMLLAERCRTQEEKDVVKAVLEKVMKVKLDMEVYYKSLENAELYNRESSVIWTSSMRRLSVLVSSCLKNNEPVLLVGETGCGKTTVCQLIAEYLGKQLITINAHQNTETGDILGAQRPNRHRSDLQASLTRAIRSALDIEEEHGANLDELIKVYESADKSRLSHVDIEEIAKLKDKLNVLFEWCDGPLTHALKSGEFFLLDEISLADDSVLERLNSVLEPERSLLLAEKGGSDSLIQAADGFEFFATMNPGGDYGKKELSPALRNRFTEIWVPSMENFVDVHMIVSSKLEAGLASLANPIVKFSKWFGEKFGGGRTNSGVISLRDILSWVEFVNSCASKLPSPNSALVQGASMVFIDSLGTNNTAYLADNAEALLAQKFECVKVLSDLVSADLFPLYQEEPILEVDEQQIRIGMFGLDKRCSTTIPQFNLSAPTTAKNLMRVVRAMQVSKPVLLEGSPGVGKTSLVSALADCTGNKLTRINLSEQTDLVDLFGSDAPGEKTGEFVWRDAPFLRAMQLGEWVLLDEMNLASQSVLEGLNACLDHRGEAYVPELDRAFKKHANFRVFAAQNPQHQGGGRKGLPKSFVNRFSVVYMDILSSQDLFLIATHLYPEIDANVCSNMIEMISTLEEEVSNRKQWGHAGSPWEFNLRDTLRWLKLLNAPSFDTQNGAADYVDLIITQRFRTAEDRSKVQQIFNRFFGEFHARANFLNSAPDFLQVNGELVSRNPFITNTALKNVFPLQCNINIYESVLRCVNNNWPLILVGPTSSGKTEIIKYIAGMLGSKVMNFPMNSDIDSMDILGGYEQVDQNRKISQQVDKLFSILRQLLAINIASQEAGEEAKLVALELFQFISAQPIDASKLENLLLLINKLMLYVDAQELGSITTELELIKKCLGQETVKFEWFDGLLLKAMEEGSWLVLDNANLCSPSVLDRLNSLLETEGVLIINECSHEDGTPRVVNPHPNFRLFLTVDPKYGELSRAMRNRSIEIYLEKLESRASSFDKAKLSLIEDIESSDQASYGDEAQGAQSMKNSPLSSFVSATSSLETQYALLHDVLQTSGNRILESVVAIMPHKAIPNLRRWQKNVSHSRYYDEVRIVENITNFGIFLQETGIHEKFSPLLAEYQILGSKILGKQNSFGGSQSLMPAINTYTLKTLELSHKFVVSGEPVYLFEVCRLLQVFTNNLEKVSRRAQQAKIADLSYIEISAAHTQGRAVKKAPQIPIFGALQRLRNYILEQIQTVPLLSLPENYTKLFELCCIWMGAYETAKTFNYAKLRVYQKVLEIWQHETGSNVNNTEEVLKIAQSIGNHLVLETGRSMTAIWDEFRQVYPSSLKSWQKYEAMLAVARKFDNVARKQSSDSYELINSLRTIFRDLKDAIVANEASTFEDILSKLAHGVEELEEISSKFLTKRRHFLEEVFESLLRAVYCCNRTDLQPILRISSYTSISTETLLKTEAESPSYPPIFDLLWQKEKGTFTSHVFSVFDNSVLEQLVQKVNYLKHISNSQMSQALQDATVLSRDLVAFSSSILSSKESYFKELLYDWYARIASLHVDIKPTATIEEIKRATTASEDGWFKSINENFLLAAIDLASDYKSHSSLGKAWILFSVGLMQLFVPSSPYDPAIHDYVLFDNFMVKRSFSEELKRCWKDCRTVISGDEPMMLESFIDQSCDLRPPKRPRVYRSEEALDPLFEEWSAFMKSTVGIEPVDKLLKSLSTLDAMSESQLNLFQQNSSQFLERLSSTFHRYSDLNDIFRGYICGLKFGFDLLREGQKEENITAAFSPLWTLDCLALTSIERINGSFTELQEMFRKKTVKSVEVERISTFFMKLFSFHGRDPRLLKSFEGVLQTLYYRWSMRRLQDEKEAQSQVGIFKFDESDVDPESDFKKLFPDYEDVLSIGDGTTVVPAEEMSLDEIYFKIANTYLDIFDKKDKSSLPELMAEGTKICDVLLNLKLDCKTKGPDARELTSVLNQLIKEIQLFEISGSNESIDFYRECSVSETRKATTVVQNLWFSVNNLRRQWPEHSTLNDLFRICHEFMEYSGNTPLARLLQKVEQLFTIVTEWEKYASVTVSLQSSLRELTELIVSWRRLELSTWKRLFDHEDCAINKSLGKWWFYLFETIIVSQTAGEEHADLEDQSSTKLLVSLNVFLSKCTYGEFGSRLRLLKAFSEHCKLLENKSSRTLHALLNLITFYEQFLPIIDERIREGRKRLEKDISEVILLASWKDVNIDALKQSSHRSHNSLYKLVRKYRDILSQDMSSVIESGIDGSCATTVVKAIFEPLSNDEVDFTSLQGVVSAVASWSTRPASLKDISLTSKNMSVYCSNIEAEELPNFTDYIKDVSEEAARLRKETPKVYNKKEKKLLAALKIQKSKLLNDTIKELRRMGLKTGFREDIRKVQVSVTSILSSIDSFRETELQDCDRYFHRILELMPRLRLAASNPADGAPIPAIEKGMALNENLVYLLITSRGQLREFADNLDATAQLRKELDGISSTKSALLNPSLKTDYKTFLHLCKWLPEVLNYALDTLDLVSKDRSHQKEIIADALVKVSEFESTSSGMEVLDNEQQAIMKKFWQFCDKLIKSLLETSSSECFFVSQTIVEWIQQNRVVEAAQVDNEKSEDVEIIEKAFRRVAVSIMLTVQKLLEDQKIPLTMEEDKWLVLSHKRVLSLSRKVLSVDVLTKMTDALTLVKSRNFSRHNSKIVTAIAQLTMPIISKYYQILVSLMNKIKVHYCSLSHGTLTLETLLYSLGKDGFCSPSPPDEETTDDNLHDGTGLGDGDGAQNNNDGVEEDEDLLEDAQKPNKDKDEDDGQEENEDDNAIDMEGDIAGDLENASEGDEDDQDNSEEEDLDEEVDDLDEDDPNAIDEKMWNEDAKDSNKEKNTEETPQNATNEDVQAAEENEEKEGAENGDNKAEPQRDEGDEKDDGEEMETGSESEQEDETGGQNDEVKDEEAGELETHVPEVETLELPEDINLDSGEEGSEDNSEDEDSSGDMDVDEKDQLAEEDKDSESGNPEDPEENSNLQNDDSGDDMAEEGDGEEEEEEEKEEEENDESAGMENGNMEELEADEEQGDAVSDHELAAEDPDNDCGDKEDENQEAGGDESTADKMEGLDGADDMMDIENDEIDSAVQQKSGANGEGADATQEEENQNVGSFGSAQQEQKEREESEMNESSRQEAKESLKQLGDSLKEFHRRHQEIKDSSNPEKESETDEFANQRPDEFEHVDGANTNTDTQALGSANQDQITAIDEEMAIDDDMEETENNEENDLSEQVKGEEPNENSQHAETEKSQEQDSEGKTQSSLPQDKNDFDTQASLPDFNNLENEKNDLDEIIDAIDHKVSLEEAAAEPPRSLEESRQLWRKSESETAELSAGLSEQLRLILEPTLATKLKGDYKTGKRLNMKRIIPYIASQFRKDKIWLRRTKPSKRQYQIMIAVDDSKSMSESKSVDLAFQSICLVSKALTQLESGGLSIVKFGQTTQEVHQFDQPFGVDAGAKIFRWFDFQETKTDVKKLVAESIRIFDRARASSNADLWQLQLIISDGVCEDHETIQRLVRRARDNKIMLVFVIVDGINSSESIMDMSQVKYLPDQYGNFQLKVEKYLDTFPFEFYVVVHDISELPEMLSVILRQYFSELAST
ncbi:LAQU0S25e00232g1_1 [Lachancea quebecensis]|uniref:Midasin n=1 Tax=Lachancea quebecensis TaxID=1654605 RepID=A0A0P1KY45_9SACH|nr:LAQU0S25e00232g1_1 [Lachancea quebecensis]